MAPSSARSGFLTRCLMQTTSLTCASCARASRTRALRRWRRAMWTATGDYGGVQNEFDLMQLTNAFNSRSVALAMQLGPGEDRVVWPKTVADVQRRLSGFSGLNRGPFAASSLHACLTCRSRLPRPSRPSARRLRRLRRRLAHHLRCRRPPLGRTCRPRAAPARCASTGAAASLLPAVRVLLRVARSARRTARSAASHRPSKVAAAHRSERQAERRVALEGRALAAEAHAAGAVSLAGAEAV